MKRQAPGIITNLEFMGFEEGKEIIGTLRVSSRINCDSGINCVPRMIEGLSFNFKLDEKKRKMIVDFNTGYFYGTPHQLAINYRKNVASLSMLKNCKDPSEFEDKPIQEGVYHIDRYADNLQGKWDLSSRIIYTGYVKIPSDRLVSPSGNSYNDLKKIVLFDITSIKSISLGSTEYSSSTSDNNNLRNFSSDLINKIKEKKEYFSTFITIPHSKSQSPF